MFWGPGQGNYTGQVYPFRPRWRTCCSGSSSTSISRSLQNKETLALPVLFALRLSHQPSAALSNTFQNIFFTYVGLNTLILTNVYVNTEQMDTLAVFRGWDFSWLPILYLCHLFTCQHVESGKVGGFGRRYTHTCPFFSGFLASLPSYRRVPLG